jgi:hypothetical protein
MQTISLKAKIIEEINLIPENKLEQLYQFIRLFRLGLERLKELTYQQTLPVQPLSSDNLSLQKRKILEMERKQAEGYAKYPVQPGEFDIWEAEQVWGDEWHETR